MSIKENLQNRISEGILIKKARNGSHYAYGKLYMKYIDSIYRYIFFRVNCDRFETEDLTESVFVKAWDSLTNGSFHNENFRAWLYKIAHNTVIDSYRKSGKFVALNDAVPDKHNTEEDFLKKSGEKELLMAVNSLPEDQKQVLTLKFIEDLKNEEIAGIMEKSNEAIRALQYRALTNLRKKLASSNPPERRKIKK